METLLVPRTLLHAVLLKFALLAQLLMAFTTLKIIFIRKLTPVNDLLAFAHWAKEEILSIIENLGIVAEADILLPHVDRANHLNLFLGGPGLAAMLQAPEIFMPHLLFYQGAEGFLVAHEAENVVASAKF